MKQLLEGLATVKTRISDKFHPEANHLFNKNEVTFNGTVNFFGKIPDSMNDLKNLISANNNLQNQLK